MSNPIKCTIPEEFIGKTWEQIARQLGIPKQVLYSEFNRNGKDLVKAYEKIKARKPKVIIITNDTGEDVRFETISDFCDYANIPYFRMETLRAKGLTYQDIYNNVKVISVKPNSAFITSDGREFETIGDFSNFLGISLYLYYLLCGKFNCNAEQLYQLKKNNKIIPGADLPPANVGCVVVISNTLKFNTWRSVCNFLELPYHHYSIMMDLGMSHKDIFNSIITKDIIYFTEKIDKLQERNKRKQEERVKFLEEKAKKRAAKNIVPEPVINLPQVGQAIVLSNGVTFPTVEVFREFLGMSASRYNSVLKAKELSIEDLYAMRLEDDHENLDISFYTKKLPLVPVIVSGIKLFNNWIEMIRHIGITASLYSFQRTLGLTDEQIYNSNKKK